MNDFSITVYGKKIRFNLVMVYLFLNAAFGILTVKLFPQLYVVFPTNLYLTMHNVAEIASVVISCAVFIVAWYNYKQSKRLYELLISLTFLAVGIIDFAHTLSYNGMPDFLTVNSVNKASTYWIVARLVQAVGFLAIVITTQSRIKKNLNSNIYLGITISVTILSVWYIALRGKGLPPMYQVGKGQTDAKLMFEYLIIGMEFAALVILSIKKSQSTRYYLEAAILLGIFSEIAFTLYSSAYDTYNLIGHIYKIVAFICILRGLFVTSVVNLHLANRILRERRRKLNEANRKLERVNTLKTDFLASTNHELRTPLTAIIAFTELLMDKETGPLNEVQLDYLHEINESSQILLTEINNILDLSKVEAGRMKLHIEKAEICEVLQVVLRQLRPVFKQKKQKVEIVLLKELPSAFMDIDKIKKVFINLLYNAHKFSHEEGIITVEITLSEDSGGIQVNVRDNGIGLSMDQVANIFDKFYQVESTLNKHQHGTGLGLTLARHFVELHGGRIWVKSAIEQGSTFSFVIPLAVKEGVAV